MKRIVLLIFFTALLGGLAFTTISLAGPICELHKQVRKQAQIPRNPHAKPSDKIQDSTIFYAELGVPPERAQALAAYHSTKEYLKNQYLAEAILKIFEKLGVRNKADLKRTWELIRTDGMIEQDEIMKLVNLVKDQLKNVIPGPSIKNVKVLSDLSYQSGISPNKIRELQTLLYDENQKLADDAIKIMLIDPDEDLLSSVEKKLSWSRQAINYLLSFIPYSSQPTSVALLTTGIVAAGAVAVGQGEQTSAKVEGVIETNNAKQEAQSTAPEKKSEEEDPLGAKFVLIEKGSFLMGDEIDTKTETDIAEDFYLQTTPVTQEQWWKIMGTTPSFHNNAQDCPASFKIVWPYPGESRTICPNRPVERVSYNDVREFINKLNSIQTKYTYDLPSEKQWEYAARAKTNTKYFWGENPEAMNEYTWSRQNSNNQTHDVALKKPNPNGLYDIYGNVWEWTNGEEGTRKILRGGSYNENSEIRSAARISAKPSLQQSFYGFRLMRTPRTP